MSSLIQFSEVNNIKFFNCAQVQRTSFNIATNFHTDENYMIENLISGSTFEGSGFTEWEETSGTNIFFCAKQAYYFTKK